MQNSAATSEADSSAGTGMPAGATGSLQQPQTGGNGIPRTNPGGQLARPVDAPLGRGNSGKHSLGGGTPSALSRQIPFKGIPGITTPHSARQQPQQPQQLRQAKLQAQAHQLLDQINAKQRQIAEANQRYQLLKQKCEACHSRRAAMTTELQQQVASLQQSQGSPEYASQTRQKAEKLQVVVHQLAQQHEALNHQVVIQEQLLLQSQQELAELSQSQTHVQRSLADQSRQHVGSLASAPATNGASLASMPRSDWAESKDGNGRKYWWNPSTRETHWYNPAMVDAGLRYFRAGQIPPADVVEHLRLFKLESQQALAQQPSPELAAKHGEVVRFFDEQESMRQRVEQERIERERQQEAERLRLAEEARQRQEAERQRQLELQRQREERHRQAVIANRPKAAALLRKFLESLGYSKAWVPEEMIEEAVAHAEPPATGEDGEEEEEEEAAYEQAARIAIDHFQRDVREKDRVVQKRELEAMREEDLNILDITSTDPSKRAKREAEERFQRDFNDFFRFRSAKSAYRGSLATDAEGTGAGALDSAGSARNDRRKSREPSRDAAIALAQFDRRPRRQVKSRLVNVEGNMILKINNDPSVAEEGLLPTDTRRAVRPGKSAFNFFVAEKNPVIKAEFPTLIFRDIQKILSERWRQLDTAGRDYYEDLAAKDKARFVAETQAAAEQDLKNMEHNERVMQAQNERERLIAQAKEESEAAEQNARAESQAAGSTPTGRAPPRTQYPDLGEAALLALGSRAGLSLEQITHWVQSTRLGRLMMGRLKSQYDDMFLQKAVKKNMNRGRYTQQRVRGKAKLIHAVKVSGAALLEIANLPSLAEKREQDKEERLKAKGSSTAAAKAQRSAALEMARISHREGMKRDIFESNQCQWAFMCRHREALDPFITDDVRRMLDKAADLLKKKGRGELLENDPSGYAQLDKELEESHRAACAREAAAIASSSAGQDSATSIVKAEPGVMDCLAPLAATSAEPVVGGQAQPEQNTTDPAPKADGESVTEAGASGKSVSVAPAGASSTIEKDGKGAAGATAGLSEGGSADNAKVKDERTGAGDDANVEAGFKQGGVKTPKASSVRRRRPECDQPEEISWGELRPYQREGLRWLVSTFENGINAILADEMGLGKTLQTVSFLTHLKFELGVGGPFLIIVPLSVLTAWANEFARWSPKMRVVKLHSSSKEARDRLKRDILADINGFDVAITTFEMVTSNNMKYILSSRVWWRYVVIDEGHKIKNDETDLSSAVRSINCQGRLLLTGTPLQNNLHELWSLLNYLYPTIFTDSSTFDNCFDLAKQIVQEDMLEKAHYLIRPFVLRRTKDEVEQKMPPKEEIEVKVPLSKMQRHWYKMLLMRDAKLLERVEASVQGEGQGAAVGAGSGAGDKSAAGDWKKLQSLMMQLRKCCNHPYLFPNAEPYFDGTTREDLVEASGKLQMLDRILKKLHAKGHRVVIFSQFTNTLDILQDFCTLRGYKFSRLDGSTNRVQRAIDIMQFNRENSTYFAYLMSTRAGGLGINLATADTVVLYDSDWNPQVDLQAMDRVHRIGQTKPVHVYRLVAAGTVEERVVQRAKKKLYLDRMVNRGSTSQAEALESLSKAEMLKMLKFGASAVFGGDGGGGGGISDKALDRMMDRSRLDGHGHGQVLESSISADTTDVQDASLNALDFDGTQEALSLRNLDGVEYPRNSTKQPVLPAAGTKRKLEEASSEDPLAKLAAESEGKTTIDGKEVAKSSMSMKDIAEEWAAMHPELYGPTTKRARVSRYVEIDGHTVLKANNYTLEEGEKSVFDSELAKDKQSGIAAHGRQIAGRDYDNEGHCLRCWDGGDLLLCDQCCASYHESCLLPHQLPPSRNGQSGGAVTWGCPHHSCRECGQKAHASGGMLFRCTECPTAFCEDHLPIDDVHLNENGREERFEALGQRKPAQAYFIQCSPACTQFAKTRKVDGVLAAINEAQAARAKHGVKPE